MQHMLLQFSFPSKRAHRSRPYVNFFQPKEEHTPPPKAIVLPFFFYFAELRRFFQLNDKQSTQVKCL